MSQKEIIILTSKELKRLKIIQETINKHITQKISASMLTLSQRQITNLVQRVRRQGYKGIVHKLRGRFSNRKIPLKLKNRVISLYKSRYPDFAYLSLRKTLRTK